MLLRKYNFDSPVFCVALAEFRTTPRTTDIGSPAEILQSPLQRTLVPGHTSALNSKTLDPIKVTKTLTPSVRPQT